MREADPLPDPRTPEGVRDISEGAEPAEGVPPQLLAFSIHSRRVSSSLVLSVLSDHTTVKGSSVEGRTDESDGMRRSSRISSCQKLKSTSNCWCSTEI